MEAGADFRDAFICGRCKKEFCLLTEFLKHKGKCGRNGLGNQVVNSIGGVSVGSESTGGTTVISSQKGSNRKSLATSSQAVVASALASKKVIRKKASKVAKKNETVVVPQLNVQCLVPQVLIAPNLVSGEVVQEKSRCAPVASPAKKLRPLLPKSLHAVLPPLNKSLEAVNSIPVASQTTWKILVAPRQDSPSTSLPGHVDASSSQNSFSASQEIRSDLCNDPGRYMSSESSDESDDPTSGNEVALVDYRKQFRAESKADPSSKVCRFCGRKFSRTAYLENHLRSHTGFKPFQCILCGRCFAQKSNATRHVDSHKDWPREIRSSFIYDPGNTFTLSSYTCPVCGKMFMRHQDYRGHMPLHNDKKVFVCFTRECGLEFQTISSLKEHLVIHPVKQFGCHLCERTFPSLNVVLDHQKEHKRDGSSVQGTTLNGDAVAGKTKKRSPRFSCHVCGLRYVKQEALKRHLAATTHNYPCTVCEEIFLSDKARRDHLRRSHDINDESRQCPVCSKVFKNKHNLGLHMRRHTGERQYRCTACSTSFSRRDVFMKHKRKHEPYKLFPCTFRKCGCSSEFSTEDILKVHLRWHGSEEPYRCPFCSKDYVERAKLSSHLKKLHSGYDGNLSCPSRCLTCQKEYFNFFQFLDHTCPERIFYKQKAAQDEAEFEVSSVGRNRDLHLPQGSNCPEADSDHDTPDDETLEIFISIDKE